MILLSVIVPTIERRQGLLSRLLFHLGEQLDDRAEVLVMDNHAGMGTKVTAALQVAQGRMSVVIDDDDLVPPDYTTTLCDAIAANPVDFIGYRILRTFDHLFRQSIAHSVDGDPEWSKSPRGVTPKCPFRTDLARDLIFDDSDQGDRTWSKQLHRRCSSGLFIDRHMYHHDEHTGGSSFGGSRTVDVGTWPVDRARFRWWTSIPEESQ